VQRWRPFHGKNAHGRNIAFKQSIGAWVVLCAMNITSAGSSLSFLKQRMQRIDNAPGDAFRGAMCGGNLRLA